LTVIGNHDHLGNGRTIFETMFGRRNEIVDVAHYRFILFDDVVWESGQAPDIQWLQWALMGAGSRIPVLMAHIPPFTDQLTGAYEQAIRELAEVYDVPLFIYGHLHQFNDHEPYADGVRYLGVPTPQRRTYVKVTLMGQEVTIQEVRL
jgi:Icc-related predicted phosphoesterase